MDHDFNAQKAETFATYAELQAEHGLPDEADIDYFFVAAREGADWRALAHDLSLDGYDCEWIEDDEAGDYLVATLAEQVVSAMSVWLGEEVATRHALAHGFAPDGWGMEG